MVIPAKTDRVPPQAAPAPDPVRVMVVDDSALIRGAISRRLETERDIRVVATASDGKIAVSTLKRMIVDVIVLDIEMPNLDGLSAIPQLLAVTSAVKIVMASTLTHAGAEVSLKALAAGAADYVAKPSSIRDVTGLPNFQRDLIDKVRQLGLSARRFGSRRRDVGDGTTAASAPSVPSGLGRPLFGERTTLKLKSASTTPPRVLAIGSSTGGPQAVFQLLKQLPQNFNLPILLTQHMPATFTTIFAEHIGRQTGHPAVEAADGQVLVPGRVHVARGDHHLTVAAQAGGPPVIHLNQGAQENFCRPAVDPMLRSLIDVYGAAVLTVILTGMGQDGLKGCEAVVRAGGTVLAQDEASSVVWGMPGAVATAGLCAAVLPLTELAPKVQQLTSRMV